MNTRKLPCSFHFSSIPLYSLYMNFDFTQTDKSFADAAEYLKQEFLQISTGRANPALLDRVMVNSYGTLQPIKNISSINMEDARSMKIVPWDKSQIKDIEKSLHDSQLPFSVSVDDTGVRVHVPQMTEESKKEIMKLVKDKLEEARIKVRNIRQEAQKTIEAGEDRGDYGEDAKNNFKDALQKKVDMINKALEESFSKKETDLMSV